MTDISGRTCPHCQEVIKAHFTVTTCPTCNTVYHAWCWKEHKGCVTADCNTKITKTRTKPQEGSEATSFDTLATTLAAIMVVLYVVAEVALLVLIKGKG
ncbi:MAG: RING finger protein [Armatimonadota bacterium]